MTKDNAKVLSLSDSVIAHVARLLQVSMLTGTDIVDHMRMIVLEEKDGSIFLNPEYAKNSDENLKKMLDEIPEPEEDGE